MGWWDQEDGWTRAKHELQRMKVRAKRRWLLTLLITATLTGGLVYRNSKKRKRFKASITFLIKEQRADSGERTAPPTKAQLKNYVFDGVFTSQAMKAIRKKYKLFQKTYDLDRQWSLDKVRDAIDINVSRNYFTSDNTEVERSARVKISFTYTDPDIAVKVCRALGRLMRRAEQRARRNIADAVAESQRRALWASESEVRRLYGVLALKYKELDLHKKGSLRYGQVWVEIQAIRKRSEAIRDRMSVLRQRDVQQRLRARLEKKSLGLQFKQVALNHPELPKLSRAAELSIVGAIVFFALLPLCGMGVAIADPRVYTLDDVRQVGLEPIGHVPKYKGWQNGGMKSRERVELLKSD